MKTVPEYHAEILEIQEKIKAVQAACPHTNYEVVMYSYRVGNCYPIRLCVCCKATILGITDEESRKAWEDFYKDTNDFLC